MNQLNRGPTKLAVMVVSIITASLSTIHAADGFYTIIGPDGRPMIVSNKKVQSETQKIQKPQQPLTEVNSNIEPKTVVKQATAQTQVVISPQTNESVKIEEAPHSNVHQAVIPSVEGSVDQRTTVVEQTSTYTPIQQQIQQQQPARVEQTLSTPLNEEKVVAPPKASNSVHNMVVIKPETVKKQQDPTPQKKPQTVDGVDAFMTIDGVKYVNNEFLEDKEFNIEGKKRFYTMPDGLGRFEQVEREKGVSRSVLKELFKRPVEAQPPIVLASTYMRLSTENLTEIFGSNQCFLSDYKKKIKSLSLQKEVNLWPRKPLQEKFEYELVKLEGENPYVQLTSYSPSNNKPVFYWPLVVFLDQKGCAFEGVSGFKNSVESETFIHHPSIHGVIKIPATARYLMVTPLSTAIDVDEKALINQGQIKFSALGQN